MDAPQPLRTPLPAHAPKAKPDARPMRLALGAGGLAALSALATAIILPPRPVTQAMPVAAPQQQTDTTSATGTPLQAQRPIRYIQLGPGETAPPGATVIPATAPTPITVVVNVPAPAAKRPAAQQPIVVKTTQSGTVIP